MKPEPTEEEIELLKSKGFIHTYSWAFRKGHRIYSFEFADLTDEKVFNENLRKYFIDAVMPEPRWRA